MTVALIELDYHPEVLRVSCELLLAAGYQVQVYTTENLWRQVDFGDSNDALQLDLCTAKQSVGSYLDTRLDALNRCDLIIINTLYAYARQLDRLYFRPPLAIRIHNANFSLRPFSSWLAPGSARDVVKCANFLLVDAGLRGALAAHLRLIRRADWLIFPDESIQNHMLAEGAVKANKLPDVILPMGYASDASENNAIVQSSDFKFVISGQVDQRRRDYELVLKAFDLAAEALHPCELVLLGPPVGQAGLNLQAAFQTLAARNPNLRVKCYDGFVAQSEFEAQMRSANVVLLPLLTTVRYKCFRESFGTTKYSGSINDLIRYQKVGLICSGYPIPEGFADRLQQFETAQELADLLSDMPSLRVLAKAAKPSQADDYYSFANAVERTQLSIIQMAKSAS